MSVMSALLEMHGPAGPGELLDERSRGLRGNVDEADLRALGSAKRRTVAAPMPCPPPVTSTVLPFRSGCIAPAMSCPRFLPCRLPLRGASGSLHMPSRPRRGKVIHHTYCPALSSRLGSSA